MLFDMPLEDLKDYLPPREEPCDFDVFWQRTLVETRSFPLNAVFEPIDCELRTLKVFDVTFDGYGGHPIKGWLLHPRQHQGSLPCVVEYLGYNHGRGFPLDWLLWGSVGYVQLVMDTRGQGSHVARTGDTPDPEPAGGHPHYPGFLTQGVLEPNRYFYRRVFADAVRAVEAARSHPAVDGGRIAVTGRSQGGGIALAVGALEPSVSAVMVDVPFLCHFRRATEITDETPYLEVSKYCQAHRDKLDMVFNTLSYFDGVNFAARCDAPALFSVGLMDRVCPPSTVFAAFNHFAGPKRIKIWRYSYHEAGGTWDTVGKVKFLSDLWH